MKGGLGSDLPHGHLKALDFLVGDSAGPGMLFPPNRTPVRFDGHLHVEREHSDRFLRLEFYGEAASIGMESIHSLMSYSEKLGCYRMWNFLSSQEDPLEMHGEFTDGNLVFVSDPTHTVWGLQQMRCTFSPLAEGVVEYYAELWDIAGYTPYFHATYAMSSVLVEPR